MTIIATCSYAGSQEPQENLRRHIRAIDEARGAGAELLAFPECSLHGYPDRRARTTAAGLRRVWEQAEDSSTGPFCMRLVEHVASAGMHVVFGITERTSRHGRVHNTAILAGPDGVIGAYRKVHLGASERPVWSAGNDWPVFDTAIGRIGMMICVDSAWPEGARELALGGADILVVPTAWSFVVGGSRSIDARWAEYYLLFQRARAAENFRWVVSANYVGELGESSYGGYSQIVDPLGRVRVSSLDDAGVFHADVDIVGELLDAEAGWFGPRIEDDRRTATYRRQHS